MQYTSFVGEFENLHEMLGKTNVWSQMVVQNGDLPWLESKKSQKKIKSK